MTKPPREFEMIDSKSTAYAVIFKQTAEACRQAAIEAYEDAQIRGLCAEGAFEAAMQAIDNLKQQVPEADIDPQNQPETSPDEASKPIRD